MQKFQIIGRPAVSGRLAVRFILVSAGVFALSLAATVLLIGVVPPPITPGRVVFPPAFWVTTALLALGSGCLMRAKRCVRLERQAPFRRSLVAALAAGGLFVTLQTYGLRSLAVNQAPDDVQTGANAFVTALAALHAMHFSLALLLLVWVTLNAFADRYDHEYSWGVTVCAWFWHALGLVWLLILVPLVIACTPALEQVR